jgi:hypothetical protein
MAQELTAMAGTALSPVVTESGYITLSVDGTGTNNASGTVQVLKPTGATVRKAFLAAVSTGFSGYKLSNTDVRIDGQTVTWTNSIASSTNSWNHWADVTSLVKTKINSAPAGRVSFSITETDTYSVDGEVLAVIFDNPAETTTNTVVLLFGAQNIAGDTFQLRLAEPINKADPNLKLDLSLGISYGYQTGASSETQRSIINVNNTRMTSMAGGQDDGENNNGALITVGGLDDTNTNPSPNATGPGPRGDDELYDLRPFVSNGATQITVFTQNPSNDDNIFFGALYLASAAAVVGEGIVLGPTDGSGFVGQSHTVTATLQDDLGRALANRTVTFKVTAGPHAGKTGTATSNAQGKATFTYTGSAAGTDELQASFVKSSGQTATSNLARMKWTQQNQAPVALCQNLMLNADAACGASGSINAGSFDPDGDAITCTQSQSTFSLGSYNVTLNCSDAAGLKSSCSANVTVVDNTAPAISCPADPAPAECTNGGAQVSLGNATATDNCGTPGISSVPASFPLGTHTVPFTAYDASGNVSTCTTTVTVADTQGPVITLNGDADLSVKCSSSAVFVDPGASAVDQCEGSVSVGVSGSVDLTTPGSYTLTYGAGDSAGRSSLAVRVVTVVEGPECSGGHEAGWALTGSMWADRLLHTATLLPNGKVLVAGAFNRSTELYDVGSGTFSRTGDTRVARRYHVMEQLADGRVLIAGGAQNPMGPVSAEVYDSATGVWTATGNMVTPRGHAASVRLANGKVLVMGGVDAAGSVLSSSELYDPATGSWSLSGFLGQARRNHTATVLSNGKVLVTGGTSGSSSSLLTSAEVYDPATGSWSAVGNMATPRTFHTATLLPNGKVLVAGGGDADFARSASAELFDPATGAFTSTASMAGARRQHTATLLNNGLVLVSGGVHQMTGIHYASELYNPETGAWMSTASMNVDRYAHTSTLLPDGRVLAVGGASNHSQKSAELYTFVK